MNLNNELKIELIPVLITILETLSVTESAKKLGVTQSAVSHSLKKLRDQFGDELVIRDGHKLVPTTKAESIYPGLKKWMGDLENIVGSAGFDPKTSNKNFYIATSDIVEHLYLPLIISYLKKHAPNIGIRMIRWHADKVFNQLANSEINLAIGVRSPASPNIMQRVLYKETFTCAARKGHPIFKSNLGLEDFLSYPHTMTSSGDRVKGVVDKALEKINRQRRLIHTVGNFSSGPIIIANSDSLLTAPKRYLEHSAQTLPIKTFKPPLDLPEFEVKLMWSKKEQKDKANVWLRKALYEIFKQAPILN